MSAASTSTRPARGSVERAATSRSSASKDLRPAIGLGSSSVSHSGAWCKIISRLHGGLRADLVSVTVTTYIAAQIRVHNNLPTMTLNLIQTLIITLTLLLNSTQ